MFASAKVRRFCPDSKDLTKILFELLRRYGGYATKGRNRVECCRKGIKNGAPLSPDVNYKSILMNNTLCPYSCMVFILSCSEVLQAMSLACGCRQRVSCRHLNSINTQKMRVNILRYFFFRKLYKKETTRRWLLKWSRGDKVLLPALSGVVKTFVLTLQRYELFS